MTASHRTLLLEGLIAGIIGYAAIACFFLLWNLVTGQPPLHTAATLGRVFIGGGADGAAAAVFAFNGLHLLVFLALGLGSAWLLHETELHPEMWYLSFVAFVGGFVGGLSVLLALASVVGALLSPWLILAAGVVAGSAMGLYLTRAHLRLVRLIRDAPEAFDGS